jgi:hypothetical protein
VNVVSLASPPLQELYTWLEVEFHPLQLCSRVHTVVEELLADETSPLQQYVPALQDVTLVRLIRQVSQVYQTIEIARLLELARFASAFHLERLLVDCVRHNDMQVRDCTFHFDSYSVSPSHRLSCTDRVIYLYVTEICRVLFAKCTRHVQKVSSDCAYRPCRWRERGAPVR